MEDGLDTRTFFKPKDQNEYIPTSSCHPPKWKGNIPKGQLMRFLRNCCTLEDFEVQADIVIKKFEEKEYQKNRKSK